jgi:hypothetical protein
VTGEHVADDLVRRETEAADLKMGTLPEIEARGGGHKAGEIDREREAGGGRLKDVRAIQIGCLIYIDLNFSYFQSIGMPIENGW